MSSNLTSAAAGSHVLQPDLTFWFDLPPDVAAARLAGARVPDKFESQPQAFFERVRAGYRARAQAHPQRFAVINALGTPEEVFARVTDAAALRIWWPQAGAGAA